MLTLMCLPFVLLLFCDFTTRNPEQEAHDRESAGQPCARHVPVRLKPSWVVQDEAKVPQRIADPSNPKREVCPTPTPVPCHVGRENPTPKKYHSLYEY